MNCEQAENFISAHFDGELAGEELAQLEAHLSECEACRAVAGALAAQDAALAGAFAGRRAAAGAVGDRVIEALAGMGGREGLEGQTKMSAPPGAGEAVGGREGSQGQTRMSAPPARWGRSLVAAAAGFLLAVGIMRPWEKGRVVVERPSQTQPTTAGVGLGARPVAQLALATGAVFVCPSESDRWRPLETGGSVDAGMRVRTGPKVFCEFKMADGSEVRLNAQTEVTLASARRVEVAGGQVFSSVRKAEEAFVVSAAGAGTTLTALGTAFDVSCSPRSAKLTVVEGSVKVASVGGGENVVRGGESLSVDDGQMGAKTPVENLMRATQWVDEILVMKGRDDPELAKRVDDIFAQLGHEKMWYLNAQEVRRLGDHCVVPLTRYIESDRSKSEQDRPKRREAARIVGDVATTWAIPELINLLADEDGDVRYAAAMALQRLTGNSLGREPRAWRDQPLLTCAPTIGDWHEWWETNKGRFPGADPDAVRPAAVVKQGKLPTKG